MCSRDKECLRARMARKLEDNMSNEKTNAAKKPVKAWVLGVMVITAFVLLPVIFGSCRSPLGFGKPIDWEPPVLTLDPGYPNPMYVRLGTKLTGTVTDNIGVDRVILREAGTGVEMFQAVLLPENRWEITLDFTEEQNNQKIMVEIVSYDAVGNSGESSIVAITLIVDIRPPIIEDMWISRSPVRTAYLEAYNSLKELETTDAKGEKSDNVNRYQNGHFYISGKAAEEETRIEVISLNIYDANEPNDPLVTLPRLEDSSAYSPRWLISEDAILASGEARWPGYTSNYYVNNHRYYYRVAITAVDRSNNESEHVVIEDEGFFCMWERADEPKGILDPLVGLLVTKGSTFPVEFYDDDTLDWAYTGLLTQEQWNGGYDIYPGVKLPDPPGDREVKNMAKLDFLKNRLTSGQDVYDWRYERYPQDTPQPVVEQIGGKTREEMIVYVQTGNNDNDAGEYVLFTLTADKKLDPHTGLGPRDTNRSRWMPRSWDVQVIDENEPLIVFDTVITRAELLENPAEFDYNPSQHLGSSVKEVFEFARTGNSPEENTFPRLTDGRYFELNGYTLRANKVNQDEDKKNFVQYFRMAWIPNGMPGTEDEKIDAVRKALIAEDYPATIDSLVGVQHWDFSPVFKQDYSDYITPPSAPTPQQGILIEGSVETIGDNEFRKQVFRKKFDILGNDPDTLKSGYRNFTYNGVRENDTKLFVIYAEDNVGHVVYRQMRLLGEKKPPQLAVYDITGKTGYDNLGDTTGLPNLNNDVIADGPVYFDPVTGLVEADGRARYRTDLNAFQQAGYAALRPVALSSSPGQQPVLKTLEATGAMASYPRDTELKYWVMAEKSGDLAVADITMYDITNESTTGVYPKTGSYNGNPPGNSGSTMYDTDRSLSYIEMLPEITVRVFLFVATDTLGNEARIQRTVAVTNAAVLTNITTPNETGSYGIGKTITLQANFTNLVYWRGTNPPLLNVRYNHNGPVLRQIPTKTPRGEAVLSLQFDFVVAETDTGRLETMRYGMSAPAGDDTTEDNRPIKLPSGTEIIDNTRGTTAFTPRNGNGAIDWQDDIKSLQGSKTITLQGIRPRITGITLTNPGKLNQPYTDSWPGYYYKTNDTIELTLTADNPIFSSGSPTMGLQLDTNNLWRNLTWQRASGTNAMVFSVVVNPTNTPDDGKVRAIRLNDASRIVDSVGNAFADGIDPLPIIASLPATTSGHNVAVINIDKTPPTAPSYSITPAGQNGTGADTGKTVYNTNPILAIPAGSGGEPYPIPAEYSLNDGAAWRTFPNAETALSWTTVDGSNLKISNGEWNFVTRYVDRAGNESPLTRVPMLVNAEFPRLLGIGASIGGTYKGGENLTFTLNFADTVTIGGSGTLSITLADMTSTTHNPDGTADSYEITLTQTNATASGSTVTFAWNNISGKDMINGLKITGLSLGRLRDRYGSIGPTVGAITNNSITVPAGTGVPQQYTAPYNLSGIIVSSIQPKVRSYEPQNAQGRAVGTDITAHSANNGITNGLTVTTTDVATGSVSADNKTIRLTFSKPLQKGKGTITIKPHGTYVIPPVIENEGYYTDQGETGTKYTSPGTGRTYVQGMVDITNSVSTADVTILNGGTTLSNPPLDERTGQTVGPYIRMTHGLKKGPGYTGAYSTGADGPFYSGADSIGTDYMIPDVATKWVLDYRYSIDNSNNTQYTPTGTANATPTAASTTVVPAIRGVLTRAKFRWQEIDVTSGNVTITTRTAGGVTYGVVTITLSEPLLKGLQWDLCYPTGTFMDLAGNNAPSLNYTTPVATETIMGDNVTDYWFWSNGVQTPVIRVNRKSFDARTQNWATSITTSANSPGRYAVPTDREATYPSAGWGINDFSTVHYRIETETPNANIYYNTIREQASTTSTRSIAIVNSNTITGWNTTVPGGTGGTGNAARSWIRDTYDGAGTWERPNLIRRTATSATVAGSYRVWENNVQITRNFSSTHRGYRSFNKDATVTELAAGALMTTGVQTITSSVSSGTALNFTYYPTEASKSYVIARAAVNHQGNANYPAADATGNYISYRGYEGVFRSVIALYQSNARTGTSVEGSNIKNGMPSIAGFPVRDAEETGDCRFVKLFYVDGSHHLWVSTEIVSQWYFLKWGGGSNQTHQGSGDVNNYLAAGYGDLSFGYHVTPDS